MFDASKIWGIPIHDSTYLIPSGWLVILGWFPLKFAHTFFWKDLLFLTFQSSLFGTKCEEDFRSYHTVALSFQGNEYLFNFQGNSQIGLPYGPSHWPVNPTSQCWDLGLGTPECLPSLLQVHHHCPAEDSKNMQICSWWIRIIELTEHTHPLPWYKLYTPAFKEKCMYLPPLDHYNRISHFMLQTVTKNPKLWNLSANIFHSFDRFLPSFPSLTTAMRYGSHLLSDQQVFQTWNPLPACFHAHFLRRQWFWSIQ
jgi:hypothetical protein